jgi:hypothetical protein
VAAHSMTLVQERKRVAHSRVRSSGEIGAVHCGGYETSTSGAHHPTPSSQDAPSRWPSARQDGRRGAGRYRGSRRRSRPSWPRPPPASARSRTLHRRGAKSGRSLVRHCGYGRLPGDSPRAGRGGSAEITAGDQLSHRRIARQWFRRGERPPRLLRPSGTLAAEFQMRRKLDRLESFKQAIHGRIGSTDLAVTRSAQTSIHICSSLGGI